MADLIRSEGGEVTNLFDTLSYYDDSEPTWDERPYFEVIERHRNKPGFHIDVRATADCFREPTLLTGDELFYPGIDQDSVNRRLFMDDLVGHRYRVILSGKGGDELLGGVPTPYPETWRLCTSP